VIWVLMERDRLFRSTDRGDSWEERPLPARSPSGPSRANAEMSFVSDREGWLSSVGPPATQCQIQSIAIWHTTDAGSSWEQLPAVGIRDGQCKSDLAFVDTLHGYVGAWDQNQRPLIYGSSDGGRHWSASRPLPDPPGFTALGAGVSLRPGPVSAFGSTLLLAADDPQQRFAFRSQDGGASWSYITTIGEYGIPVAFLSSSRWLKLVLGVGAQESTDAGATWHQYLTDYSQAAPIAPSVVFGDAQVGYATVRGGIQRTLDGGAHWSLIKTPGTA